jgi:tetratricopeptide (TPR) repeat protein
LRVTSQLMKPAALASCVAQLMGVDFRSHACFVRHAIRLVLGDIRLSLVYGVLATCAALACACGLGRLVVGSPSVWCIADRDRARRTGAARKNPETYLPYVAATLNNVGMLDRDQNRIEEALKTYRELAQKDPQTFLPEVAMTLNNLGILDSAQNRMKELPK